MASSMFGQKEVGLSDAISYWIFCHDDNGALISDKVILEQLTSKFLAYVTPFIEEYIWNDQCFNLCVDTSSSSDDLTGEVMPHIRGSISVGDVLEDEWFTVFLLLSITKEFPGTVCRVVDSDGEFLLIEAAEQLPRWASSPQYTEQRVFLSEGSVHLIPPLFHLPLDRPPPIMEAVTAVQSHQTNTLASSAINQVIQAKVEGYPGKIRREQHVCHAYVPLGVAALLREYPTLVAPAVHAFCSRDNSDNKALRVMKHFPPETRVMTAVRLSKALYAQLMSRPYLPDQRTGWSLPAHSHQDHKAHSIGVKLACGFEILVCSAGGVTPASTPSTEQPPTEFGMDINLNPRWNTYKQSLTDKGYFRGELEGSKMYNELENNARQFFMNNMLSSGNDPDGTDALSMGSVVIKLLSKVNQDYDFYKERQSRLHPPDDDSWLHITPDALDDMLNKKFNSNNKSDSESNIPASEEEMKDSLSAFFNHVSDMEGAEIPTELQDKLRKLSTLSRPRKDSLVPRKPSNARRISGLLANHPQHRKISAQSNVSDGSNSSEMSSFSNKIDFHADSFTDAINNILEFSFTDDDYWENSDEDSSGMSSYGEDGCDDTNSSRKSSNTSHKSNTSRASSGVDTDMNDYIKQMEQELSKTTLADNLSSQKSKDEEDNEFEDVEDFKPVKVDMRAVRDLVKAYTEEKGKPGPATALLGSIGLKPKNLQ